MHEYEREVQDYPEIPCCSCERFFKRAQVTNVNLTHNVSDHLHYMNTFCNTIHM